LQFYFFIGVFMAFYKTVLEAFENAKRDERNNMDTAVKFAIETLVSACKDGYELDFNDALKLVKLAYESANPSIGAGALYNFGGLEDEIHRMDMAQHSFEESCHVADDRRDYAWEADAASINLENARCAI
jgi:hypothetical protein